MLTLFEYLRQRAFEAVIAGTQDAVEFLESQRSFDQLDGSDADDSRLSHQSDKSRGGKEGSTGKPGDDGVLVEKPLPAPRRRGRAKKKGASGS